MTSYTKQEKAAYDKIYRKANREKINIVRNKKYDSRKSAFDYAKKINDPLYREKRFQYARKSSSKVFGEFAECWLLIKEIDDQTKGRKKSKWN